jgi:MFS superfamily sulfate permease-like transporter
VVSGSAELSFGDQIDLASGEYLCWLPFFVLAFVAFGQVVLFGMSCTKKVDHISDLFFLASYGLCADLHSAFFDLPSSRCIVHTQRLLLHMWKQVILRELVILALAALVQVAFLVGLLYFIVGIFRLSYLANFLSHSVISGFTSGAACIIGITQLKYFLGLPKLPNTETAIKALVEVRKNIKMSQWREMIMFTIFLIMLLIMKHVSQKVQKLLWMRCMGPMTVAVIGIVTVVAGNLDEKKLIKTVKTVPQGVHLCCWTLEFQLEPLWSVLAVFFRSWAVAVPLKPAVPVVPLHL